MAGPLSSRTILRTSAAAFILVLLGGAGYWSLPGRQKLRQLRTMGTLRAIAAALDAYRQDHGVLPADYAAAWRSTEPLPVVDEWGYPFVYRVSIGAEYPSFSLLSRGSDGAEQSALSLSDVTATLSDDIVMRDTMFEQAPRLVSCPPQACSFGEFLQFWGSPRIDPRNTCYAERSLQ